MQSGAFEVPSPQTLALCNRETDPRAKSRRTAAEPPRFKVVDQQQRPTRLDHAVGLREDGCAVLDIADRQCADHGLEGVVAEREPVAICDSDANRPTHRMSALRRKAEPLGVEVHGNQFDAGRVPLKVEPGADTDFEGSPRCLATHPLPAVSDRPPFEEVPRPAIQTPAGAVGSGWAQHAELLRRAYAGTPRSERLCGPSAVAKPVSSGVAG